MYVLRIGALPILFLCFYSFVSDNYFKLKYIKRHHKLQAFRFYYILFSLQGVQKVKINPGKIGVIVLYFGGWRKIVLGFAVPFFQLIWRRKKIVVYKNNEVSHGSCEKLVYLEFFMFILYTLSRSGNKFLRREEKFCLLFPPPLSMSRCTRSTVHLEQVLQGWLKEISLAFCQVCDTCRGCVASSLTSLFWTIF